MRREPTSIKMFPPKKKELRLYAEEKKIALDAKGKTTLGKIIRWCVLQVTGIGI